MSHGLRKNPRSTSVTVNSVEFLNVSLKLQKRTNTAAAELKNISRKKCWEFKRLSILTNYIRYTDL